MGHADPEKFLGEGQLELRLGPRVYPEISEVEFFADWRLPHAKENAAALSCLRIFLNDHSINPAPKFLRLQLQGLGNLLV